MSAFFDKNNYTKSPDELQFVLEKDVVLKKTHATIYAKQEAFMKSYIELNNSKRTKCSKNKYKIRAESYKLMSSSTFVKQIENVRKYKDIPTVNNEVKGKTLAAKSTFRDVFILSSTAALYDMKKGLFCEVNQFK